MMFDDDPEAADSSGFEPGELAEPDDAVPPTPDSPAIRLPPEFNGPVPFPPLLMELAEERE
jgi:hypothetical protein